MNLNKDLGNKPTDISLLHITSFSLSIYQWGLGSHWKMILIILKFMQHAKILKHSLT